MDIVRLQRDRQSQHIADAAHGLEPMELLAQPAFGKDRPLEEPDLLLERAILAKGRLRKEFHGLKTVSGIGDVLALTIALETDDVHRFASVRQVRFLRAQ